MAFTTNDLSPEQKDKLENDLKFRILCNMVVASLENKEYKKGLKLLDQVS